MACCFPDVSYHRAIYSSSPDGRFSDSLLAAQYGVNDIWQPNTLRSLVPAESFHSGAASVRTSVTSGVLDRRERLWIHFRDRKTFACLRSRTHA